MTSFGCHLLFNSFENVNSSSSYEGLSAHQIWFSFGRGKQSYGGGGFRPPPQVANVLNRPGEIGLRRCSKTWEHRKLK